MPEFLNDNWAYTLADPEYYEPLDRLKANEAQFMDLVRRMLPAGWWSGRHDIWFHCRPDGATTPPQGWKIHLSSAQATAQPLLATVVPILVESRTQFKCAIDRFVLGMLQGKGYSRGGAGKFITIYPRDVDDCRRLLDCLDEATVGFTGQYILSDRRYRKSSVVHYRYGGFHPTRRLHVEGGTIAVIKDLEGQFIDDDRTPYFRLPDGVVDPFFEPEPDDGGEPGTLKNGRYLVTSAFAFGNAGGVYLATDRTTGETVVIKEARPTTNQSARVGDAFTLIKKEHRLLSTLADAAVAPRALDFFQDWEHLYLVEEYVPGETFRDYMRARCRLAMKARPTRADVEEYWAAFQWIFARITDVLATVHARRVVFGDVSYNNVMIADDAVKFIDFEGAHEEGVDSPPPFFTAGFAPRQKLDEQAGTAEDDWYAIGSLMVNAMLPMPQLMSLNPSACDVFLDSFIGDFGLPEQCAAAIRTLLSEDRSARGGAATARTAYEVALPDREPRLRTDNVDTEDWPALLEKILSHIDSTADFTRDDRLFAGSAEMFRTNPLNVAYGACGVAWAKHRITGSVDQRVLDWILARPVSPEAYPPGLYVGLSGIAWTLLDIGCRERAGEILAMTFDHPLLHEAPGFYVGAAGTGTTFLKFFLRTEDEQYLARARQIGDRLLASGLREDGRRWWPVGEQEFCGLGHGGAGVALFLLYLSHATGNVSYAEAGDEALAHVLAKANAIDDALGWRIREDDPTVTPYWCWGNAGIGTVLLRYDRARRDGRFVGTLDSLAADVARKYSIFSGFHSGLAGMADFLLDLASTSNDAAQVRAAARLPLSGLLNFKVPRPTGVGFPGDDRLRLNCDFANGSAGIAYVIDRYLRGGAPAFLVDELLTRESWPAPAIPAPRAALANATMLEPV